MFYKTRYMVDTTNGPKHYTRYHLNVKALLTTLLAIALIACTIFVVIASAPTIKVHCTNANVLVFQDNDGNYLAYVQHANAEQLEQIKNLNVAVDQSVDDFRLCKTEVHHYEIRLAGEKVFVHADDVKIIPSEYNHTLNEQEESDMLESSSEEAKYLYRELNRIFHIED